MALGTTNPFPRSIGSFQVPVAAPDIDPDAQPLVTVCFSADWLACVLGALQQLTLQATWLGDDDAVTLAVNRAQLLLSMFGSSNGGCVNGLCITGVVYDDDCDCILWTIPGTDTTVENPALDPRHSDGLRYPPNTAEDPQCQAAANMTRWISDLIGEVITVVDTAGTAEGLIAILLPFLVELGPFGILIDLVLGVAFILFSAGATAIAAAFTSTVYDQLTCIFFCNIGADGTVSAEQLAGILDDINTQIGGLVYTVLSAMFFLMGEVGLSNAGAVGDAPADCSACDCLECENCIVPTSSEWSEPLCSGTGNLVFTMDGMFSNIHNVSLSQGAVCDLNDFVAPGAGGWVVCYQTTEGITMRANLAAEGFGIYPACTSGSTIDLGAPNTPVIVDADHPVIFLGWAADDNGITGLCVAPH